jgi:hypothetical protein
LGKPAEFLIDLVSIDYEDPDQAQKDIERIDYLALQFQRKHPIPPNDPSWTPPTLASTKPGRLRRITGDSASTTDNLIQCSKLHLLHLVRRFTALLARSWKQNLRDCELNLFRLFASIGQALFFAQKYRSVRKGFPPTAKSIADRTALLSFGVINMSMVSSCYTYIFEVLDWFELLPTLFCLLFCNRTMGMNITCSWQ